MFDIYIKDVAGIENNSPQAFHARFQTMAAAQEYIRFKKIFRKSDWEKLGWFTTMFIYNPIIVPDYEIMEINN